MFLFVWNVYFAGVFVCYSWYHVLNNKKGAEPDLKKRRRQSKRGQLVCILNMERNRLSNYYLIKQQIR